MTNANYTDITFLMDRSGSMNGVANDVIGGFDSFVEKQKEVDGKCLMTVIQFDDAYEVVKEAVALKDVPKGASFYSCRGMTALYDAVGKAMTAAGERFRKMAESDRPGKVLFVINTDGHENASQEYCREAIKNLVKEQETKYDWDFVFIGADFDVKSAYGDFVNKPGRTSNTNKARLINTYGLLNDSVTQYRNATLEGKNNVNFDGNE